MSVYEMNVQRDIIKMKQALPLYIQQFADIVKTF